jgi:hypothetical protein
MKFLVKAIDQKEAVDRINKALDIAWSDSWYDGDHHKMWVIDQMVRALSGPDYDKFVKDYEREYKDDGEICSSEWDPGRAP